MSPIRLIALAFGAVLAIFGVVALAIQVKVGDSICGSALSPFVVTTPGLANVAFCQSPLTGQWVIGITLLGFAVASFVFAGRHRHPQSASDEKN